MGAAEKTYVAADTNGLEALRAFAAQKFPHKDGNELRVGVEVPVPFEFGKGVIHPKMVGFEGLDVYRRSAHSRDYNQPVAMVFGDLEGADKVRVRVVQERILRDAAGAAVEPSYISAESVVSEFGECEDGIPLVVLVRRELDFHDFVRKQAKRLGLKQTFGRAANDNGPKAPVLDEHFGPDVAEMLTALGINGSVIDLITDNTDEVAALYDAGIKRVTSEQTYPPYEVLPVYNDRMRAIFADEGIPFGLPSVAEDEYVDTVLPVMINVHGEAIPCHVVTYKNLPDGEHDYPRNHFAIVIGDPDKVDGSAYVRMHARCFTGDNCGSKRCDCGPQLQQAIGKAWQHGSGIVIYLDQEGREHGLKNKLYEYYLQIMHNVGTYKASMAYGLPEDGRRYNFVQKMLAPLTRNATDITLRTNNDNKVRQLLEAGVRVTGKLTTRIVADRGNFFYLLTKAREGGHAMPVDGIINSLAIGEGFKSELRAMNLGEVELSAETCAAILKICDRAGLKNGTGHVYGKDGHASHPAWELNAG